MKKIFTFFIAASLSYSGFAQNSNYQKPTGIQNSYVRNNVGIKSNYGKSVSNTPGTLRSTTVKDTTYTVYPNNFVADSICSDTTKTYYFAGNYYSEIAKAQYYSINLNNYDSAEINNIWAAVWVYQNANSNATITAQVYEFDTTSNVGAPTNLLGTSDPVLLTDLTNNPFQSFSFSSPVSVPDHGFIAVAITTPTTAGDTTIVYSSPAGCTDSPLNAWEYYPHPSAGDIWWPITWAWGSGQGLDGPAVDFHIFPEISFYYTDTTTTPTGIKNNAVSNLNIAPNPVNHVLNVNFKSIQSVVSLKIVNITGQLVYSETMNNSNGTFNTSFDMSNVSTGVYFLQVSSNDGTITKKIIKN